MTRQRGQGGCLPSLFGLLAVVAFCIAMLVALAVAVPSVGYVLEGAGLPVSDLVARFVPGAIGRGLSTSADKVKSLDEIDEDGLAFLSLTDEQKVLYQQMLDGVRSLEESFTVYGATRADIDPVYHAVLVDHPELFWVDGSTRYTYYDDDRPIEITPGLSVAREEIEGIRAQIEAVADAFLATIPDGADDYTKAKMAYAYVIQSTDYDASASQNQNIQSVFLGHRSVCAGYARAFQYLLQRAGMSCSFVEGTIVSTGEEHAWNVARLDGTWTYVDVTWGDPTYPGLEEMDVGVVYDYLGLTTDEILRDDHAFADQEMWPACTSSDCNYYVREGLMFDSADEGLLSASLMAQRANGAYPAVFRFSSEAAYAQALGQLSTGDFLLDDIRQILSEKGTLEQGYQYQCSDSLHILKLFL